MKKLIGRFLVLAVVMLSLFGCGMSDSAPVTLEDTIAIPEDGVIDAAVLAKLKEENRVVVFSGESEGIHYEWTVFGKEIPEVKELNLGIRVMQSTDRVVFEFASKESFGFTPALSLYLNETWKANEAMVYRISGPGRARQGLIKITGSEQSILNFVPAQQTGRMEIVPYAKEKEASQTEASEQAETSSAVQSLQDSDLPEEPQRPVSTGEATEQDSYQTDPVPEGKPLPEEPEEQEVDEQTAYTCTFSIECSTILNHLEDLEAGKLDVLPASGVIFSAQAVTFYEGESVYDVLQRVCRENGIHLEASWTPMYNSAYVEGIQNLYEFDCGSGSGWMYCVDGWYPNYGCSRYQLAEGEVVEWRYTCDLGNDIGGGYAAGN